jgi:hypothetical protein
MTANLLLYFSISFSTNLHQLLEILTTHFIFPFFDNLQFFYQTLQYLQTVYYFISLISQLIAPVQIICL